MQAFTRALSVLCILAVGLSVNAQTPKVFTVAGGHMETECRRPPQAGTFKVGGGRR